MLEGADIRNCLQSGETFHEAHASRQFKEWFGNSGPEHSADVDVNGHHISI